MQTILQATFLYAFNLIEIAFIEICFESPVDITGIGAMIWLIQCQFINMKDYW